VNRSYDVIVIGGGINGAGIARDAAERGLSVFLADKDDFGAGTTFRSTKLIHGGLRYLEHYEIGLVRESLREREILMKIAPHLVKPIRFVLPIYEDNKYGYGKVKLGLIAYDMLSYDKSLENHQAFTSDELKTVEPHIRTRHCRGGFTYYDCQVSYPERLGLENILLARHAGAAIHSYTKVVGFLQEGNQICGVVAEDQLTREQMSVHGRVVVNASGPWVDEVLQLGALPTAKQMGGTKGSHILIDRFEAGPQNAVYVPAHQDGRPFFIIPWRQYYWVGTTDVRYQDNLDKVCASNDEVDYLLREINFVFPMAQLGREDVLYALAGVRPLPVTKSATEEAEITRRHLILDHEDDGYEGLISIIGGKLTTYRNLAEETVDYLYKKMDMDAPPCPTSFKALWGGRMNHDPEHIKAYIAQASARYRLESEQVAYLLSIYGSKTRDVLQLIETDSSMRGRLAKQSPDIKAQAIFSAQHEMIRTVSDFLLRRTGLGTGASKGLDTVKTAAKTLGHVLNWDRERIRREIETYERSVEKLYGLG
jgi:glycerol-3-phosphate dehydrogenase